MTPPTPPAAAPPRAAAQPAAAAPSIPDAKTAATALPTPAAQPATSAPPTPAAQPAAQAPHTPEAQSTTPAPPAPNARPPAVNTPPPASPPQRPAATPAPPTPPQAAAATAIEILQTDAALHALAPEWATLWQSAPAAAPFQSPAWLLPWWTIFGTGRPVIATLRHHGRLAGLLPLYLLEESGRTKLLPAGIGLSDYLDILLAPGLGPEAAAVLLAAALHAARQAGAATCDLPELPPASPLLPLLRPPATPFGGALTQGETCPVLEGGLAAIPPRQRRKLRMNQNRAERLGGTAIAYADTETAPLMLEALLALNAARWGAADRAALAFHRLAVPALHKAGLLRLAQLAIGGTPACLCYALRDATRLMFYMIGFNPRFAEASPGSLLIGAMIVDAIAEGRTIHFLRGNEAYKYAWGAVDRRNAGWHFAFADSEKK